MLQPKKTNPTTKQERSSSAQKLEVLLHCLGCVWHNAAGCSEKTTSCRRWRLINARQELAQASKWVPGAPETETLFPRHKSIGPAADGVQTVPCFGNSACCHLWVRQGELWGKARSPCTLFHLSCSIQQQPAVRVQRHMEHHADTLWIALFSSSVPQAHVIPLCLQLGASLLGSTVAKRAEMAVRASLQCSILAL